VYDCRSEGSHRSSRRNLYLDAAVLSSVLLMMIVIYLPFLSVFFGTAVLTAGEWAVVCAAAFLPALVDRVAELPGRFRRFSRQKSANRSAGAP
jgi:Ca2+-transporting ATPase